ncbi:MAG TPA: hypothetical protein VIN08_11465 [Ohtaekwangia sp.]|uniref:hypothetical protein n=1 Tax=Ohtaekwangia sp. TaxID=2066019 RepID=UPI002F93C3A9
MEKTENLKRLQNLVDQQFNKILKLTIGGTSYNIAIRKDQIPQLHTVRIDGNRLVISFDDSIEIPDSINELELLRNHDGSINAVIISHPQKLEKGSYRTKLNRILINEVKSLPDDGDKRTVLFKHIQTRIVHALSEIIKTGPKSFA